METDDGKKVGSRLGSCARILAVSDGGHAHERATHRERDLERAIRALFYRMCARDGRAIGKNVANVAEGRTRPARMLVRRFKEAKAARHDRHNYPLVKQTVAEIDAFIDELFQQQRDRQRGAVTTTGDHPRAA